MQVWRGPVDTEGLPDVLVFYPISMYVFWGWSGDIFWYLFGVLAGVKELVLFLVHVLTVPSLV